LSWALVKPLNFRGALTTEFNESNHPEANDKVQWAF